jgi:hypothetical protein
MTRGWWKGFTSKPSALVTTITRVIWTMSNGSEKWMGLSPCHTPFDVTAIGIMHVAAVPFDETISTASQTWQPRQCSTNSQRPQSTRVAAISHPQTQNTKFSARFHQTAQKGIANNLISHLHYNRRNQIHTTTSSSTSTGLAFLISRQRDRRPKGTMQLNNTHNQESTYNQRKKSQSRITWTPIKSQTESVNYFKIHLKSAPPIDHL